MTAPHSESSKILGRTLLEWFSSLPVFALLALTLIIGTGEMVHGQLLKLGESMFGDAQVQYFMLRAEPVKPECDANMNIETELARQLAAPADEGDDIDDLFGSDATANDPGAKRKALEQALAICQGKHRLYAQVLERQTSEVKTYRSLETAFFGLFKLGSDHRSLILLLMVSIAAITTTLGFHHIGIRPGHYTRDYMVQSWSQLVGNSLLLYSSIRYYMILRQGGGVIEEEHLHYIWMALFSTLALINAWRVIKPPTSPHGLGEWGPALLAAPLYAQMAIITGSYFLLHGHDAGLAIYVNQLMALPTIFMNLALFIWAGMLLKQSRVVDLVLNVIRPWNLSPQLLTYIILLGASYATAYTGASGIFVIAAGGVIYHEVRAAGGSRQFSLAATAMSGSLGVVLRPCLLIVLIAALNKEVTTATLYHWGFYVFLLTSTLFFMVSQMLRTARAAIESPRVAIPGMLREVVPVLPYAIIAVAIVFVYERFLDTKLDELTAPTIMPVILLLILLLDKLINKGKTEQTPDYASHRQDGVEKSIRYATTETIGHVGALLSLMMISLAIGGVIERSEVMHLFPQVFENHWYAAFFIMLVMVFLGMIMDPFGAVLLVTATLAPVAYANNIDPVHFWMLVLVAFELGYLTPPVALNQLLTRQVIGEEEVSTADREAARLGFYRRYERWILPLVVMSIGLLLVTFGPLAVQDFESLHFVRNWFPLPQQ